MQVGSKFPSIFDHLINKIFAIHYKAIELCTASGLDEATFGSNKFSVDDASFEVDDSVSLVDNFVLAFNGLDLGLGKNTKRKEKDNNDDRKIFHLSCRSL